MGLFDKFKKKESDIWDAFVRKYEASPNLVKPSEHILAACKAAGFPDALLDFMKNYGFGNYGNGIVKLIDPEEYMNGLYTWLGGRDFSKIPFMMTGFGDLYYFRNLGDGNYDIAMLDIHYRNITVPAWSIEDFVSYITDEETAANILRRDLFREAAAKCGRLEADEIYYFVPALIIGGAEDIKYINKGKANVHHQVLFQLGSH